MTPNPTGIDIGETWRLAQKFPSLSSLVSSFLPKILLAGGIIFFVLIIIAGLGVIAGTGSGDTHANENRKNFLTYAVVGLIIMFGAYWIIQIINFITGGSLGGIIGP